MKTAFTLLAIVAVFTYRIWPRPLQNIVFYLLLFLTLGLIGLEVIRFAIFLVCYLFGYRIWIFPDLDRDDKGIFGVFTPGIIEGLLSIAGDALQLGQKLPGPIAAVIFA